MKQKRPNEKLAGYAKSERSGVAGVRKEVVRGQTHSPGADSTAGSAGHSGAERSAKTPGIAARDLLAEKHQGARNGATGRVEQRGRLLESYLRGLTDHRNNLGEYIVELEREREELERERRNLDLEIEANEEKREQLASYIEEIPQLRDMALRSLVKGMAEPEDR